MQCLIVYYADGKWYAEEVGWKRSGTGWYRETSRIEIPQTRDEIEAFAKANRFKIEWRGDLPDEPPAATPEAASATASAAASASSPAAAPAHA